MALLHPSNVGETMFSLPSWTQQGKLSHKGRLLLRLSTADVRVPVVSVCAVHWLPARS